MKENYIPLASKALSKIDSSLTELKNIRMDEYNFFIDMLTRWKSRTVAMLKTTVSEHEGKLFEKSELLQHRIVSFEYSEHDLAYDLINFYIFKLEAIKHEIENHPESIFDPGNIPAGQAWDFFFKQMHTSVQKVSYSTFSSGHYAEAVLAAFIEYNDQVKMLYKVLKSTELDGQDLMHKAFSTDGSAIKLADLNTDTGKNIQEGFRFISAGSMGGIRNPLSHKNLTIEPDEAIHKLFLASLLFKTLDKRLS